MINTARIFHVICHIVCIQFHIINRMSYLSWRKNKSYASLLPGGLAYTLSLINSTRVMINDFCQRKTDPILFAVSRD
jgi:hypothetical protein